jgi:hypothetical protein
MAAQRGQGNSMTPGSQPLSFEQMRRTWALVDILTSLKRRTNHPPPTAEQIIRKFDTLPMPALDALSILVKSTMRDLHAGLGQGMVCGVRARLPPKNGSDTPPKHVFSPFSLYLQCILSAIHPLYLRHSDVLYRCVFSRYVVRYRSGIGLHAWCLHVLSIQYMRLYRRFSILNDTHRYMTSLSPLPRGCCACVSIQEAPSCILTYLCLTNECIFLCPRP